MSDGLTADERDPVRDLERHRPRPPDALDGDRPPPGPRSSSRSSSPSPKRPRWCGRSVSGRVHGLSRKPRRRNRLALVAPPRPPPAGGDRRGRAAGARLRRHPSLRPAAGGDRGRCRDGLVPPGAVEAGGERGAARPAPAASTRCSSRASSRPARTAGRRGARRGEAHEVAPIVFCDDEELLPRAEAERELGLEPGMTTVLVQLGQGAEVAGAQDALPAGARRPGGSAGGRDVARRSRGSRDVPEGIVHLRATYPISRYYAAFDAAVSAAGYNAFHELVRFRVPSVFVPMQRETDDQAARARYADRSGVGVAADGPADPRLERRLEVLLDPDRRRAMRERLDELRPANGAADAARWLEELVGRPRRGGRWSARRTEPGPAVVAAGARAEPSPRRRLGCEPASDARPARLAVGLAAAPPDPGRGPRRRGRGARARRWRGARGGHRIRPSACSSSPTRSRSAPCGARASRSSTSRPATSARWRWRAATTGRSCAAGWG